MAVLAALFTYWMERVDQQRQAFVRADAQLDKIADRLTNARGEIDSASVFVERAPLALRNFDDFVSRLALTHAKSSRWLLIAAVDSGQTVEALKWVREELGDPKFNFQANPKAAPTNLYVLRTAGSWTVSMLGQDLSSTPEIYQELITNQTGPDRLSPMQAGVFLTMSGPLPTDILWVYQRATSGAELGQNAPPLYVVRGFNIAKLKVDAALDPAQQFNFSVKVGNRVQSMAGFTRTSSDTPPTNVRTVVAEPFTFELGLTSPPPPGYPHFWILSFLIGLTGTGLVFTWKAGQRAIHNADHLISTLRETRTVLDDTRDREATFFENSGTANCETDAATGNVIRVNKAMCDLFGYSPEEFVGKAVHEITYSEDSQKFQLIVEEMKANPSEARQFEKRYVKSDGSFFWALVQTKYFTGAYKDRARFLTTIIDITERKDMEASKNNLVKELAHRVRNTVQLTASMARQTAKSVANVEEYDFKFRRRLGALSAAQDVLFDASWEGADLIFLAKRTLEPFASQNLRVKLVSLHLSTQHAQTLAIAFHELASNSIAFGSLSQGGSVDFTGEVIPQTEDEEKQLHLTWLETGFNTRSRSPRQGFGHKMLFSALPGQFGGRAVEYRRANSYTYECWLTLSPTS
ncbi:MAG: PAS domain S-box protein [Aestuariivirga sp.]